MRQVQQRQQSAALQKMMQEEMGKVRSADTQAITEKYNNYARLGEMLYDKKINRDPIKRNEIQMLKDRAYSDLMGGHQWQHTVEGTRKDARSGLLVQSG